MADQLRNPGSGDDSDVEPDTESPPAAPRWVKVFGIIALIVVVLVVLLLVFGGGPGGHGPGRHTP
jgi:hypothetical protein